VVWAMQQQAAVEVESVQALGFGLATAQQGRSQNQLAARKQQF